MSPDQSRVVLRPLGFASDEAYAVIIRRALALPEKDVQRLLDEVLEEFSSRHRWLIKRLLARFHQLEHFLPPGGEHLGSAKTADRLLLHVRIFGRVRGALQPIHPSPSPTNRGCPRGACASF